MFAERVPYRDTVRIIVPESRRGVVTRGFVVQRIIKELLKMTEVHVLACQHFQTQGFFDVTFTTSEFYREARRKLTAERESEVMRGLELRFSALEYTAVVHVFNPFVEENDIGLFLRGYCAKVRGGEKMLEDGLWNGKRRYKIVLRMKADGTLNIPPRVFALGANKGRLFIPEIPVSQTCWACRKPGHTSRECSVLRCFSCMGEGHLAKDCMKEKCCNLCGASGHLFRECPERERSYAEVVGQEKGIGEGVSDVFDVLEAGEGSSESAANTGSGPHGGQDGGDVERSEDKGMGKTTAPGSRWGDEWGDHSSSQEAEMAEAVSQVRKRPLEGGEDRDDGPPSVRPAGGERDCEETTGESDEPEEEEDSGSSVDSGGALSPPPGRMPGWEEEKLMQTMGMAKGDPPKG